MGSNASRSVDDTPDQHGITEDLVTLFMQRLLGTRARPVVNSYKYRPVEWYGESYATTIKVLEVSYREEATAEDCEQVYIVKVPGGLLFVDKMDMYRREHIAYVDVVKHFRQLVGVGDGTSELPFARFVYGTLVEDGEVRDDSGQLTADQTPREIVVLEMLPGYEVVDKKVGFDLEHLRLLMPAIARLHALGYVLHQRNPELFARLRATPRPLAQLDYSKHASATLAPVRAVLEHAGMESEVEELAKLTTYEHFLAGEVGGFSEDREIVTLVHGDLWYSNILFRYKDDDVDVRRPADVKFVDLQMCCLGDLAFDLSVCLITSTRRPTRHQHMKELLGWYEAGFRKQLEELGEDPDKMAPWLSVDRLHAMYVAALRSHLPLLLYYVMYLFKSEDDNKDLSSVMNITQVEEGFGRLAERWRRGECSPDQTARILEVTEDLKEFGIL